MQCPYCQFLFKTLAATGQVTNRTVAPLVCEQCGIVSLLETGTVRKLTQPEYDMIQLSPAWRVIQIYINAVKERDATITAASDIFKTEVRPA